MVEIIDDMAPSTKILVSLHKFLSMGNSVAHNAGVNSIDILEDCLPTGFPQEPNNSCYNSNSEPGKIIITNPGSRTNAVRKRGIQPSISPKNTPH